LAGVGAKPAEVMFISPSVFREEMQSRYNNNPMMLNGAPGNLFRRIDILLHKFLDHEWFYTALVKYFAPNNLRPDAPTAPLEPRGAGWMRFEPLNQKSSSVWERSFLIPVEPLLG
jgi:hypothetical protein